MRRAVTPVLRRRRLPHLAGSRCLPNPESSPWSLYSGAGLLRGGEGVHSSDDGDSLRTVDPHRFSRNRYLPLTFPAHRTTSAHADVGKRLRASEPALTVPFPGSALFEVAYPLACHPCNEAGWDEGRPPGGRSRRPRCYDVPHPVSWTSGWPKSGSLSGEFPASFGWGPIAVPLQ
jgi:hypothetical protein